MMKAYRLVQIIPHGLYRKFFHSSSRWCIQTSNGNTLITEATSSYIFEINPSGETVWSYDYPSNISMIPRAQKYGYDYFDEISLLGDLNNDSLINILDVISCINIVLESTNLIIMLT